MSLPFLVPFLVGRAKIALPDDFFASPTAIWSSKPTLPAIPARSSVHALVSLSLRHHFKCLQGNAEGAWMAGLDPHEPDEELSRAGEPVDLVLGDEEANDHAFVE